MNGGTAMISELLEKRGLVQVWDSAKGNWADRRNKILQILCEEEYGFLPENKADVTAEIIEKNNNYCAGKVQYQKVKLTLTLENGIVSFPVSVCIPKGNEKYPFFIFLNFRPDVPDRYYPTEEICDNGFAVLSFCYKDVTSDDGDFTNGLAGVIFPDGKRKPNDCGKIGLWSYAASRVMDYAETLPQLDVSRAAVIGHSRLGKTALLTGALDDRFALAVSNDSGCSGAALSRHNQGETIADICRQFPFWFCENYKKYAGNEAMLPFDQHFLLACIAPRSLYVASAEEDLWADPNSEFLSCAAASEVYRKLGLDGLISPDRLPAAGDVFHDGNIGYHLRSGTHYLSRKDWGPVMKFFKKIQGRGK